MSIFLQLSMINAPVFVHSVNPMKRISLASMMVAAGLLSACGGGGSDSFIPNNPDIDLKSGIYLGDTPDKRSVLSLFSPQGEYWIIYSGKDSQTTFDGFLQGKLEAKAKNIVDDNGTSFAFDDKVSRTLLQGSYTANSAEISSYDTSLDKTHTFNLAYDATVNGTRPELKDISGSYQAKLHSIKGAMTNIRNDLTLNVALLGGISSTVNTTCLITGQVSNDTTSGNYFKASLQFNGTSCGALNGKTLSGPAFFFADDGKQVIAFPAISEDSTQGVLVAGFK